MRFCSFDHGPGTHRRSAATVHSHLLPQPNGKHMGDFDQILAMKRLNYFVRSCICIYVYIHIHMLDKFINIFSMKPYWLVQKKTSVCLIQLEIAEILSNKTWGKFTTRIIQREDMVRRTWTRTFGELLVYLQWAIKRGHCIKDGCWNEYSSKLEMDIYIISGSCIYWHFANFQVHGVFELQIPTAISNQCMAFKFHVQKWRFPSWGYPSHPFQLDFPWNKPSINWDTPIRKPHMDPRLSIAKTRAVEFPSLESTFTHPSGKLWNMSLHSPTHFPYFFPYISHIFPYISHIFPYISHIFSYISHIFPYISHIFPYISHIFSYISHIFSYFPIFSNIFPYISHIFPYISH